MTSEIRASRVRLFLVVVLGLFLAQAAAQELVCPVEGGTLRVGLIADVESLDPHLVGAVPGRVYANIFESLIKALPDGSIAPGVVASWEAIDETTWRLHLRDDIVFHSSGERFDAHDLKWNFDTTMDPVEPGKALSQLKGFVREIVVVDDFTVDVVLELPYAPFLTFLAPGYDTFPMRDPVAVEELGERFGREPSGTGPFRFKSWERGRQITLERNPDYWGDGPCIDELVFMIMPEASTRFAALRAGEIDFTTDLPSEQIEWLQQSDEFQVYTVPSDRAVYLQFNHGRAIWDDVRLRKAVSLAIDTELIATGLLGVLGAPMDSFLGPTHMGYVPSGFLEYDPDRAKELLREAGYEPGRDGVLHKDGSPLRVVVSTPAERDPQNPAIAAAIQDMLSRVGVQVEVFALASPVFFERQREHPAHPWDITISGFGSQALDPHHTIYNMLHSGRHPPVGHNSSRLANAELDSLLEQQAAELDLQRRLELIGDVQRLIYEETLAIPIYIRNRDYEMRVGIEGFVPHPSEWYNYLFSTVWLND